MNDVQFDAAEDGSWYWRLGFGEWVGPFQNELAAFDSAQSELDRIQSNRHAYRCGWRPIASHLY